MGYQMQVQKQSHIVSGKDNFWLYFGLSQYTGVLCLQPIFAFPVLRGLKSILGQMLDSFEILLKV